MLLAEALCFNSPKIFPLGLLREQSLSLEGFLFFFSVWVYQYHCSISLMTVALSSGEKRWPMDLEGSGMLQSPWHKGSGAGAVVRREGRKKRRRRR